MRERVFSDV